MALKKAEAVNLAAAGRLRLAREEIIDEALVAQKRAYAPYSGFSVGAAVRASSGKIYSGVNVENRSYGLTVCAERNAIGNAVTAGERELVAMAIVTDATPPALPCGACRQVMAEFNPDLALVLRGAKGQQEETTLSKLLPEPFVLKSNEYKTTPFKANSFKKSRRSRNTLARKPIA